MKKWRDLVPVNSPLQKKVQKHLLIQELEAIPLTVKQFAYLCGVTPSCVNKWASGMHKFPKAARLLLEGIVFKGATGDVLIEFFANTEEPLDILPSVQPIPPEYQEAFKKHMRKILA